MTVLIVDDNRTVRTILNAALKELGASTVVEAESAEAALALAAGAQTFDIIFIDWHLPGMNGLELLKRLRATPLYGAIPIVMSTMEAGGQNVVAALRAGATNYLIKPYNLEELHEKIGPYLKPYARISTTSLDTVQTGAIAPGQLANILQFLTQTGRSGRCELTGPAQTAVLYLAKGRIAGAQYGALQGEEAFYAAFADNPKRYLFKEDPGAAPAGCEIQLGTMGLLLEAARRSDQK